MFWNIIGKQNILKYNFFFQMRQFREFFQSVLHITNESYLVKPQWDTATHAKLSKIKTANVPSVAIYVEKMELSDTSGGNVKIYRTLENHVVIPFKVQHTSTIWLSQF